MNIKCSDIIADAADNTSRDELNRMNPQDCMPLARTIEAQGQLQPVLVKKEGDKYRLVIGFRRFVAVAICLGRDEIDANIVPADLDSVKANLLENIQRKDLTFWEECCGLREAYEDDAVMKDIERDQGMSKQWINVRWKAWYLPEEVKAQIAAGLLTFSDVQILVQKGVDAERAAAKIIDGKAAGVTTETLRTEVIGRKAIRGKKTIQQTMTKCLAVGNMPMVQALRYAIGEIEEKTLINWAHDHKDGANIE